MGGLLCWRRPRPLRRQLDGMIEPQLRSRLLDVLANPLTKRSAVRHELAQLPCAVVPNLIDLGPPLEILARFVVVDVAGEHPPRGARVADESERDPSVDRLKDGLPALIPLQDGCRRPDRREQGAVVLRAFGGTHRQLPGERRELLLALVIDELAAAR